MKFFVDTADTAEIRDLTDSGLVDGVTTNPSLIHKAGRNFLEVVAEICQIVDGPVSAEVVALDQLGVILGQPRPADMLDAPYRLVLSAVVIALRSSGTGDELLNATRALLGSWDFTFTETFPAAGLIEPDAAPSVPSAVMVAILRRVKSGGVGLQLIDVPSGDLFSFSSVDGEPETDAAHGFSDTGGSVGGALVGVMT